MNIAYSCNDAYIEQTGISMISVMENHKNVKDLVFYLIAKDITDNNIDTLKSVCSNYGREIIVVDFDTICYDLNISQMGRHIETIYSKVFFSRIKGLDKIIYLDSDTIVVDSLEDLWKYPLENCYMGVVETLPTKFFRELNLPENARFFNDGMAIVNVSFCRENGLIEKVLKVIDDFHGTPPTLSEGALNKVCFGKVEYISLKYNLMAGLLYMCKLDTTYMSHLLHYSKEELLESCGHPVVIHYLTAFYNRPWFENCSHPYKGFYLKYKALSPWKDKPLQKGKLPFRLIVIDCLYRWMGVRAVEELRHIVKRFKKNKFYTN